MEDTINTEAVPLVNMCNFEMHSNNSIEVLKITATQLRFSAYVNGNCHNVDFKSVNITCVKHTSEHMDDRDIIFEAAICSRDCPYENTPWKRGEFKAKSGNVCSMKIDRYFDDTDMDSRIRPFFTQEIRFRVKLDTQRLTNLDICNTPQISELHDWMVWFDPWGNHSDQDIANALSSVAASESPECPESFISAAAEGPDKVAILELYSSELKRTRCGRKKTWWVLFPAYILSKHHLLKRMGHALEVAAEDSTTTTTADLVPDLNALLESQLGAVEHGMRGVATHEHYIKLQLPRAADSVATLASMKTAMQMTVLSAELPAKLCGDGGYGALRIHLSVLLRFAARANELAAHVSAFNFLLNSNDLGVLAEELSKIVKECGGHHNANYYLDLMEALIIVHGSVKLQGGGPAATTLQDMLAEGIYKVGKQRINLVCESKKSLSAGFLEKFAHFSPSVIAWKGMLTTPIVDEEAFVRMTLDILTGPDDPQDAHDNISKFAVEVFLTDVPWPEKMARVARRGPKELCTWYLHAHSHGCII